MSTSTASSTEPSVAENTAIEGLSHQSNHSGFQAKHRQIIRTYELERVIHFFPPGATVLEVGAGAGWQARLLAERGFTVQAIDIPSSNYNALREWDVMLYDGVTIPCRDNSVDVVFSSNVLEHVPHIEAFQRELQRVLRPGGVSIHVMPTATWRTATTLSFFLKRALQVTGFAKKGSNSSGSHGGSSSARRSVAQKIRGAIFAPLHGVRGNLLTETYFFSSTFWTSLFRRTGWTVQKVLPNGLFYSGNRVCGAALSIEARENLAKLFGSSCKIYILTKKKS